MASVDGGLGSAAAPLSDGTRGGFAGVGVLLGSAGTTYFKMIGQDAATTSVATWVVTGAPDATAALYSGGLALPLRNVAVAATWTVTS